MGSTLSIKILSGVSAGDVFRYDLDVGRGVVIGRSPECDLVLQDTSVSRRHVKIELRSEGFFIEDEGSSHGTMHMGFPLKPGIEGARQLHAGDEFKISESLFRVEFAEDDFIERRERKRLAELGDAAKKLPLGEESPPRAKLKPKFLSAKKFRIIGILSLLLVLLLLLLPAEDKNALPKQKSNDVMPLPNPAQRIVGYWTNAAVSEDNDRTHIDKAQFNLSPSDILIEYDFNSEVPVEVLVDQSLADRLPPSSGTWQIRALIVRGVALGKERRLVFDNLEYPPKAGVAAQAIKRWAVRNVRPSPLSGDLALGDEFDPHFEAAIRLIEGIDKSPAGLYMLVRSLQVSIVKLLNELKQDAVGFRVDLAGNESLKNITEISELQSRLGAIKNERQQGVTVDSSNRHLAELTAITAELDAEIWRRVKNRLSQAALASKVKNYGEAYSLLTSAKNMFPEEADYRWILADRLYRNDSVVPKRVRDNPHRYKN